MTRFMRLLPLLFGMLAGLSPAHALNVNVTSFTLDNGMQVVVVPDRRAPVVTHMVWYKAGAADEPPGKAGVAHRNDRMDLSFSLVLLPGHDPLECLHDVRKERHNRALAVVADIANKAAGQSNAHLISVLHVDGAHQVVDE